MVVRDRLGPGFQSDLSVLALQGEVEDCGDCVRVYSPKDPYGCWANMLVFDQPPQQGDFHRWTGLFSEHFGDRPGIVHYCFGWQIPGIDRGVLGPFKAVALDCAVNETLLSTEVIPQPGTPKVLDIRPLHTDKDWEGLRQLHMASNPLETDPSNNRYRHHAVHERQQYRDMYNAGLGAYFGGFIGDVMVAHCGIYKIDGVGRYQDVGTHPKYRRQGICSAMICHAAHWSREALEVREWMIIAEEGGEALPLYQKLGFSCTREKIGCALWLLN